MQLSASPKFAARGTEKREMSLSDLPSKRLKKFGLVGRRETAQRKEGH